MKGTKLLDVRFGSFNAFFLKEFMQHVFSGLLDFLSFSFEDG